LDSSLWNPLFLPLRSVQLAREKWPVIDFSKDMTAEQMWAIGKLFRMGLTITKILIFLIIEMKSDGS
jgi:hypothetical protein